VRDASVPEAHQVAHRLPYPIRVVAGHQREVQTIHRHVDEHRRYPPKFVCQIRVVDGQAVGRIEDDTFGPGLQELVQGPAQSIVAARPVAPKEGLQPGDAGRLHQTVHHLADEPAPESHKKDADDAATATGERPRRPVRAVAEVLGRAEHAPAGGATDASAIVCEDARHRRRGRPPPTPLRP